MFQAWKVFKGNMWVCPVKNVGGIEYRLARLANTLCLLNAFPHVFTVESLEESFALVQAPFLSSVLASETIAINNNYI